jgi:hypothetical protein
MMIDFVSSERYRKMSNEWEETYEINEPTIRIEMWNKQLKLYQVVIIINLREVYILITNWMII